MQFFITQFPVKLLDNIWHNSHLGVLHTVDFGYD